jgi:hypothetical protein
MHFVNGKMRPIVAILGSAVLVVLLAMMTTDAAATASSARATPTFAVRGTVAGGIKIIQPGQTLTFVFTETNKGPGSATEDLVITKVTNAKVVGNPPCVLPNGTAINSDTPACEPGSVRAGQSASIVITTSVTGGHVRRCQSRSPDMRPSGLPAQC